MATIYSVDLRQRAVDLRKKKSMSVKKISKLLAISPESIYAWLKLDKTIGNLAPKTGYQKGHSHKIKDFVAFKKFVDLNMHDSAKTIATKLGNVSKATVAKVLKKIGYTKKKDVWLQRTKERGTGKI